MKTLLIFIHIPWYSTWQASQEYPCDLILSLFRTKGRHWSTEIRCGVERMSRFSISSAIIAVLAFIAAASRDLIVIFKSSDAYPSLSAIGQYCVSGPYSAPQNIDVNCDEKECFCADPQKVSDLTDECLLFRDEFNVDKYNELMAFFGNECGFQPQFKVSDRQ